jgi:UDPglucose 6-dehydrogenase
MKLAVIGSGYVGLVAGVGFAESGNNVTCVDKDLRKIEMLRRGEVPIFEPGLESMMERNSREGRIDFTDDTAAAVQAAQVIFIAVGTPPDEDGSADLSHVVAVAEEIGQAMTDYKVIVIKSTVPVGTNQRVTETILGKTKLPFDVVSNPEFLKEGAAIGDFMKPDRVVIGTSSERARKVMSELYGPFVRTGNPILFMKEKSAEMAKYACNAMLATRISFMNDLANLCTLAGADVASVRKAMGTDPRIGNKFLFPGVGFGGSCFPKDVQALSKTSDEFGYRLEVLDAVHRVNQAQKTVLAKMCTDHYGEDLTGKTFGIWGLAFKPNTDDMREAPAIVIIRYLLERGAKVRAYDPVAMEVAKGIFGDEIELSERAYDVVKDADGLLVVTEWNEFRTPDFPRLKELMRNPVVFDGRNLYEPERMYEYGISLYTIGRGKQLAD